MVVNSWSHHSHLVSVAGYDPHQSHVDHNIDSTGYSVGRFCGTVATCNHTRAVYCSLSDHHTSVAVVMVAELHDWHAVHISQWRDIQEPGRDVSVMMALSHCTFHLARLLIDKPVTAPWQSLKILRCTWHISTILGFCLMDGAPIAIEFRAWRIDRTTHKKDW